MNWLIIGAAVWALLALFFLAFVAGANGGSWRRR